MPKGSHARLFAPVDAGLATLPGEVVEARAPADRLDEAVRSLVAPRPVDERALVVDIARTGDVGKPLDDALSAIAASKAEAETFDRRRQLLTSAQQTAHQNLGVVIEDLVDDIIEQHLAPALAALVDKARAMVEKFLPYGMADGAFLTAPRPAREAWLAFKTTAQHYTMLRAARDSFYYGRDAQETSRGWDSATNYFAEVRNMEVVWPIIVTGNVKYTGAQPPWADDDAVLRFAKLLSQPKVELWLPTFEQQEARWWSVFGSRVEERRSAQQNLNATRIRYEHVAERKAKEKAAAAAAPPGGR